MRIGVNPEKNKKEFNRAMSHRIIIPVYLPENGGDYYTDSLSILKKCLESLIRTINYETTALTVVNNNSGNEATTIIENFIQTGKIDKHVIHRENRGKVFSVISEARASFEEFITICDADVLFFEGWEDAIFRIFKNYPRAGVVSPIPSQNLALYYNTSVFFDKFWSDIKYDKIVSNSDCDLFLKGLGNIALLRRNNHRYDWKERQYYMDNNPIALLGANHYVATYRKRILQENKNFPEKKFRKGYEEKFMDAPADILGFYRLSTTKAYGYHMGNRLDGISERSTSNSKDLIDPKIFSEIPKAKPSIIPFFLRKQTFRLLRKIKKL